MKKYFMIFFFILECLFCVKIYFTELKLTSFDFIQEKCFYNLNKVEIRFNLLFFRTSFYYQAILKKVSSFFILVLTMLDHSKMDNNFWPKNVDWIIVKKTIGFNLSWNVCRETEWHL